MPRVYEITDLLGALDEQPDGTYVPKEHPVLPRPAFPDRCQLEQSFMVVETPTGPELCIVWSQEQQVSLEIEAMVLVQIGDICLPAYSEQPIIRLGGEYPGLFLHLDQYVKGLGSVQNGFLKPGLHTALAPTKVGEMYGLIGWKPNWVEHRLCLYPDKAKGYKILNDLKAQDPTVFAERVDESLPYIDRALMPDDSSLPVIELGPTTAHWFMWWHLHYTDQTGEIR